MNNLLEEKSKLIQWITTIEDDNILRQIEKVKMNCTFNFDKEFENGISGEKLKKRTTEFIKTLT